MNARDKIAKVRWAPITAVRTRKTLFATGSYDCRNPLLTIWSFDPKSADSMEDSLVNPLASVSAQGNVSEVAFVQDGSLVVASTDDGFVRVYRITADSNGLGIELCSEWKAHSRQCEWHSGCSAFDISSLGQEQLASVGSDGRIVFSAIEGRIIHELADGDVLPLSAVRWRSPSQIVTAGLSGRISIFDHRASKASLSFSESGFRVNPLHSLAVEASRPDKIVTGSSTGTVMLWDIRNPEMPESIEFQAHESIVWEVQMYDTQVLSCSEDGNIGYWPLAPTGFTKRDQGGVAFEGKSLSLNSMHVHPELDTLITAGDDGMLFYKNMSL